MTLRFAFLALPLFLIAGCGGSSQSISFSLNPSSANVAPNGSVMVSATNIQQNGVNPPQQLDIGWQIQEAPNCQQTVMTSPPPPIPAGCEAFGVIDVPVEFKAGQDTTVTYVAPANQTTIHIQCDVSLVTGTGPKQEQIATITVE